MVCVKEGVMSPILHVTCFILTLDTSANDTLLSLSTWLDAGPGGRQ